MGHIQSQKRETTARRYVLADKFAPKASHLVDAAESRAFGKETPIVRKAGSQSAAQPDGELQDSIKSILANIK